MNIFAFEMMTYLDTEECPYGPDEDAVSGNTNEGVNEQDATAQLRLRSRPPVPDCCDGCERKEHRVIEAPQLALLFLILLGP